MNVCDFLRRFPDEQACLEHMLLTRLGDPPRCPSCGNAGALQAVNGLKGYDCRRCYRPFRPTSRTLMHHARVPVRNWFYAMLLFATSRDGVSAHFLERHLGVSYKAAWRMGDAIRRHLSALDNISRAPFNVPQSLVAIDETLVTNLIDNCGSGSAKAIVLGLTDGQRVIAMPIADRSRRTIFPLVERYVSRDVSLITDSYSTYKALTNFGYNHQVVHHDRGLWKNDLGNSTAAIESYWAALKRFLRRTHGRIMEKSLDRYIGEFNFRYNRRLALEEAFDDAISNFPDIA